MNAHDWLKNLEEYDCPTCDRKTIFKSGCNECDTYEDRQERLREVSEEIGECIKEIRHYNSRQKALESELQSLLNWFQENKDPRTR